jgi:hypothetical protein
VTSTPKREQLKLSLTCCQDWEPFRFPRRCRSQRTSSKHVLLIVPPGFSRSSFKAASLASISSNRAPRVWSRRSLASVGATLRVSRRHQAQSSGGERRSRSHRPDGERSRRHRAHRLRRHGARGALPGTSRADDRALNDRSPTGRGSNWICRTVLWSRLLHGTFPGNAPKFFRRPSVGRLSPSPGPHRATSMPRWRDDSSQAMLIE